MKLYLPLTIAVAAALLAAQPQAEAATAKPHASKQAPAKKKLKKATHAKAKAKAPVARVAERPPLPRTVLPSQTITSAPSTPGLDDWLTAGDHRFTIQHEGLTRSYLVHVPDRYQPTETTPLLVALNSYGSARTGDGGLANLRRESDYQGFIAVYPEAYGGKGQAPAWHTRTGGRDVNDVGFIAKVVHNVFRQASVDRGRIYAAGVADGGTMAYQLACDLPYVFRGVASVGGADTSGHCAEGKAVSVFHLHAQDDPTVPFSTAPVTTAKWAQQNGCELQPRKVLRHGGTYCEAYTYCRERTAVKLCAPETSAQVTAAAAPSYGIDGTRNMWAFLRSN